VAAGVTVHKTRRLTVNEVIGPGGPLEVLVNNTLYDGSKDRSKYLGGNDFTQVTTEWNTSYYSELPHEGETELWEIVNLTADAHPMHPHLVAFQVLNRQPLNVKAYMAAYNAEYALKGMPVDGYGPPLDYNCGLGAPGRGVLDRATCVLGGNPDPVAVGAAVLGAEVPPMPQEIGWKDTVQALPNMITRVLVRFAKADVPVCKSDGNGGCVDNSDDIGYDFSPSQGHGYVWHCHIVDHEDNEMMRPYQVQENKAIGRSFFPTIHY
jgi:FtsP/CotA-like multicopper oxidase with cupredoxin domain